MADNQKFNNIDDILSGVNEALRAGELSESKVKFEFVEAEEEEVSLVFEDLTDKEEEISEVPEIELAEEKLPEKAEEPEEEKSISAGIWTTYVPRFTEVSENYRMKDSSAEEEKPKPSVKRESPIELPDEAESEKIDPTAEIESEKSLPGATVVVSGSSDFSDAENVLTVYKFDTEEEAPIAEAEPEFSEEPEEEPLQGEEPEAVPLEDEAEDAEPEEEIPEEAVFEKKGPYVMPDPDAEPKKADLPAVKPSASLEIIDEQVAKKRKRSEYSSFSEKDGFLDGFLDTIMSLRVRIIAALILSFMLLFVESASYIGLDLAGFLHFETEWGAMAIIDLPFLIAVFLIVLPEVIYSFKALAFKKLVPEIILTVSFAALLIYNLLIFFFVSGDDFPLFGFIFSVYAVTSLFSAYYKKKADFAAFKVASAPGEKQVVDRKLTRNLPLEHGALDGKVESYKSRTARVFKTSFVSDFSARSSIISENTPGNILIFSVALGLALVSAVVAFFIPGGIVSAAVTFAMVLMLSVPSFVILSHKIPFYQAMLEASRESSALIGERAFYDYSAIDVVTFDDTEIFGRDDVNLQRIMVYGRKENLPKALQQMSAVFTVVGGPLAYIFANALDRRVSPADNVSVEALGVRGELEGVEVLAGNAEFMESRGIKIPHDPTNDAAISQTTRIMYAAEGGEIYAKFYIRYMLSEDFTMILPIMLDEGIIPLVYTRDPNIDAGLFRSLTAGKDSIRVLKKKSLPETERRLYQRISLGMVSIGDKINIINTILLSKKYAAFQSKIALAELPTMLGGAMLGLLLAICAPTLLSSFVLSLWHIGWSAAMIFVGKRVFGIKKDKTKEYSEESEDSEDSEDK